MGKGWFVTAGRPGDRTLAQQLVGLEHLMKCVPGKTVLDVGCAEGLISIKMAEAGALAVYGVEIVAEHVKVGHKLRGFLPVSIEVGDANTWKPFTDFDIVIMLALLQKVRDPSAVCARMAAAARELVVLRLPPENGLTIIDARSGNVPHDINRVMQLAGFELFERLAGTFGEDITYWHRVRA